MPGTALGASRNPWVQHLKASYQRDAKPKGSGTVEASGAAGEGGQRSNLTSCSSEPGGADPGFQATKSRRPRKHLGFLVRLGVRRKPTQRPSGALLAATAFQGLLMSR